MSKHTVDVEIDEDGNVTSHVEGIKGRGCLDILRKLAQALGSKSSQPRETAEMRQAQKVGVKSGR